MNQSLSYIHPEAKIAANVTIEPFATIQKNVEIGEGSWIGPNAVIMEGARIGNNCKIFPGAVIAGIPQDLKFQGEESTAEIGDNTVIREFVTLNRGTASKGKTIIGSNSLVMAYCHIAHDCIIGDHVILVNGVNLAGEVEVDDWAIVSAGTLVHQFVKIGKHVMIAGGSKVSKDVPPYITAARYPLSYDGLNSIGLKRRAFDNERINEILNIYRIIYQEGLNNTQAREHIEKNLKPSEARDEILAFMKNSSRGLIKGYSGNNNNEE